MSMIWGAFSSEWVLNSKVTFDGPNRKIIVNPGVSELDIKSDIYSKWKAWVQLYDYAKYLPALRTIGGDPVGGGQYAGDIYFLYNNWQIVVPQNIKVTGILYHDNGIDVYNVLPGGGVTATVSNLAQSVGFQGTVNVTTEPNILPKDIWDYLIAEANVEGSVGERFSKLLTVAKYLGLK